MKTLKINQILLLIIGLVVFNGCVEDDDFDTPNTNIVEPVIDGTIIEIEAVKALLEQQQAAGESIFEFEETNSYVQGYVVSNDEGGNFFEEIVIQNNFQNASAGLKVLINVSPLFGRYEVGRKIYVKLDGLAVGLSNGVVAIGEPQGSDLEKISSAQEDDFILRSAEIQTIVPNVRTLAQISDDDVNTLVQLSSAQITQSQLGLSYAGESTDEFDGDRILESCDADGGFILMQTSTFADFKALTLPSGAGSITAVLSKDFFGEQFTININTPEDVNFVGDRCEPSLLNPNIQPTLTFSNVVSRWEQEGGYVEFGLDEAPAIIEGYVISSDESGNFFEELIIQNSTDGNDAQVTLEDGDMPPNPRLGFRVSLDRQDLYQTFPFGRKVYIRLNGLAVDVENGTFNIGFPNVSEIVQIPDGLVDEFIIPGEVIEDISPRMISILGVTESDENTWLQFSDVQINRNLLGLTYSAEPADNFDGLRTLESCLEETASIELQTSTFADFKALPVPQNRGDIQGVFTRDFGDDFNVIIINSPDDIDFNNTDRCDPDFLDCTDPSGGGSAIFEEDFEGFGTYASEGWDNINISGTDTDWFISSFSGNFYSRISAFNSGNAEANVWLVTPAINMDGTTGEELSFDVQASFDNGTNLSVWVSTDYAGDPTTATWTLLDAAIPVGPASTFGNFETVGPINVSCVDGDMVVGFFYEGSDSSATTRYHVDNVVVTGN
ncbi:DUF5689 domain-containing protein [Winogradskyella sp.]|uniref:DUF5689 domain-containing protein n=1 Tax=Winogradskyella sp. TaxID=1883156 RepID=UPI0026120E3C|nr:DUF5689 domain-containing protein [Winogradskyella sp.]